jgi:hypothetical protein
MAVIGPYKERMMCGIIGYVGNRPCRNMLFEGLREFEAVLA